jgi:hypothetical protein
LVLFRLFPLPHFRPGSSHLQSDCSRSLAHQDCLLASLASVASNVTVHPRCCCWSGTSTIPKSSSGRPCQTLFSPPVALAPPTQPPTLANHQHDETLKHALPPSLMISSSPRALLRNASPLTYSEAWSNGAHCIAMDVS